MPELFPVIDSTAVSRKRPGPERGYCIGYANFEFLMSERLGFDYSLPEAAASSSACSTCWNAKPPAT